MKMKSLLFIFYFFFIFSILSLGSAIAVVPACQFNNCNNTCNFCNNNCICNNTCNICGNNVTLGVTAVGGTIYQNDVSNGIKGANVTVICSHNSSEYTKNTISKNNGEYVVFFPQNKCTYGDEVTVSAVKDGLNGENGGEITLNVFKMGCFRIDVGIVNVPLIPEFSLLIGTLTLASAIGIFFFVRRN